MVQKSFHSFFADQTHVVDPNTCNAPANGPLNVAGNGLNNNVVANDPNYINDLMLRDEDSLLRLYGWVVSSEFQPSFGSL